MQQQAQKRTQTEIQIDSAYREPKVIIAAPSLTSYVHKLKARIDSAINELKLELCSEQRPVPTAAPCPAQNSALSAAAPNGAPTETPSTTITAAHNESADTAEASAVYPIIGYKNYVAKVLPPQVITRVFTLGGKVFAQTDKNEYTLKLRLYQAEELLDGTTFVRISNAEIINLKKVHGFDLSITGTIKVLFTNGTTTYASRRYVSKLKRRLHI